MISDTAFEETSGAFAKATIYEQGNGFPDAGDYASDGNCLFAIVTIDGNIQTSGQRGNWVSATVRRVEWDACDEDDLHDARVDLDEEGEALGGVESIELRLHPIDVGFDLRTQRMPVLVPVSHGPLRVSYPDECGNRRVMCGPRPEVLERLRDLGFLVKEA